MENNNQKISINTPTAILIGSLIVAGTIIFTSDFTGTSGGVPTRNNAPENITLAPITDDDHFYGNPEAEVVMVEYSDLECPFCKLVHPTLKEIVDESRGKVAWVYRHLPLDQPHPKARKEAEATECAAELGGNDVFWAYTDELFKRTPSNNGLDLKELPLIAEAVGLNKVQFAECFNSGRWAKKVEAQFQSGLTAGVNSTPHTILINTKGKMDVVVGAESKDVFLSAIRSL